MSVKTIILGAVSLAALATPAVATQAVAAPDDVHAQAVTVYYSVANAPTFASQIRTGAAHWNSSVSNVKLQENTSRATLRYTEGNDSRGSYAQTNGHGRGTIFIDYTQARQYNQVRITAHETGHALGLPDHYSGPCSELMSGGGPGPSCTNSYPNSNERARVQSLWANGLAANDARPEQRIYETDVFPVAVH